MQYIVITFSAKLMISNVEGSSCRGRPRLGWMDGVKKGLREGSMSVELGRQKALD